MALKPADFYGAQTAIAAGVAPSSSQVKCYIDLASMVLLVLADVDIPGATFSAPPPVLPATVTPGGPLTGTSKLT